MDRKSLVLDAARRLTLERGVIPSLNDVAAAAGVSKGGLIHHFPSRAALVAGLATAALDVVDAAMIAAAADGHAAETWLRLSVPAGDDVALFRAMAIAHRALEASGDGVAAAAQTALARWESMIQQETHDAIRARIVRLVGDGLCANVLTGIEPAPGAAELDALVAALLPEAGEARS